MKYTCKHFSFIKETLLQKKNDCVSFISTSYLKKKMLLPLEMGVFERIEVFLTEMGLLKNSGK